MNRKQKEQKKKERQKQKCSRYNCKNEAGSGLCPFSLDINNSEVECDCCDDCRYECAMDI